MKISPLDKPTVFSVYSMQNFSGCSKLKISAVNKKKLLVVPKDFFSRFKSGEFYLSNTALDVVIAMCLTCLLKELDRHFLNKSEFST